MGSKLIKHKMNETSKANLRRVRDVSFIERYFKGHGIDVGGGVDCLGAHISSFPGIASVRNWDIQDGDAQFLHSIPDGAYDFVYSSHCLEHMHDPAVALGNWIRVLRPGGFLIVTVPDEDMYEGGVWPSRYNDDHKWSFTTCKQKNLNSRLPKSINVIDLIGSFALDIDCERIEKIINGYDQNLLGQDQTLGLAECAIEFICRKRTPSAGEVWQLAGVYESEGLYQQAIELYVRTIKMAPTNFDAYNHLANLLTRLGKTKEAEEVWDECVRNLPRVHSAHMYRALYLMSIGSYDRGFKYRDPLVEDQRRTAVTPPTSYPRWRGEGLQDKSIVLWTEFGLGDEIMFLRFVDIFKAQYGAKLVSVVCQQPLLNLFKTVPSIDCVVVTDDVSALPLHDYWVFPHSVPVFHSLETHGVPSAPPPFIVQGGRSQVKGYSPKGGLRVLTVGLVYKGSPAHENDRLRSITDLSALQGLFEIPGIDWVVLQKDVGADFDLMPASNRIAFVGSRLTNFLETAEICQELDLIISVDTSVAHLAGSLKIPVWLLLPTYCDWRWGVSGARTAWYSSMQIFRQEQTGDWHAVLQEVAKSLRALVLSRQN